MKKCWFHDWETINVITDAQLKADVENELKYANDKGKPIPPALRIIKEDCDKRYFEKVCVECGTYVDEISPQKERFMIEYYIPNRRREVAEAHAKRAKEAIEKIKRESRK